MTSLDGITWTLRTGTTTNSWTSVAYGGGLFVAVAPISGTNAVMTSPDGITWTSRTSPAGGNLWQDVTYGNGIFVAVSCGVTICDGSAAGRAMYSSDGITWALSSGTVSSVLNSVAYGKGLFVSIGGASYCYGLQTSNIATSPDGVTWTTRTSPGDRCWSSVSYGNGVFVAFSDLGEVMTSSDGITWKLSSTGSSSTGYDSFYGNGKFVLLKSGGSVMTSSDGFSSLPSVYQGVGNVEITNDSGTTVYGSVASPQGDTVAVPVSGLSVSTSATQYKVRVTPNNHSTLSNYTPASYNIRATVSDISVASGITEGNDATGIYNTIDNTAPEVAFTKTLFATSSGATTTTFNQPWQSVTYGGGQFVAVSATTTTSNVATSPDGINWTMRTGTTTNAWKSVTYGNGLFVAVACGVSATTCNYTAGDRIMTSSDGITWTGRRVATSTSGTAVNSTNQWNSVAYGNGIFVAVSATTTTSNVMRSTDGITWILGTGTTTNSWQSVTYGNGLFVAVGCGVSCFGSGDLVATSPDGITWTARSAVGNNDNWYSVTYGNGLFVAVGASGDRVMTSPDGITWTARSASGDDDYWRSVTYANGLFVAVGSATTGLSPVMTSPDGITWTTRSASGDNDDWYSVTYGNGLFVAVGDATGGLSPVMTSPDGINWTAQSAVGNNDWWDAITYGNGLFVAVGYNGDHVMTSPDGVTWTARTALGSNDGWLGVFYGDGLFTAVGFGSDYAMTSTDGVTWTTVSSINSSSLSGSNGVYANGTFVIAGYSSVTDGIFATLSRTDLPITPANNQLSLNFTTPADSDISSVLVLAKQSAITEAPMDGVSYATTSRIGGADTVCSFSVSASTTYTCNATYNIYNGNTYYFKIFTMDSRGNYSSGLTPYTASSTIGPVTTLGTGTDTASTTLSPGGTATTSDTFTLVTSYGSDSISDVTVTFADSTATSTSLVEITNNAGTTVYGSSTNPTSDTVTITTTGLTATSSITQYFY
jgi:hypothetical protein